MIAPIVWPHILNDKIIYPPIKDTHKNYYALIFCMSKYANRLKS